jgi:hypothetical protein
MSTPPELIRMEDFPGDDFATRWPAFVEAVYQQYLQTVAHADLRFKGLKVNCQFRPETHGKHYAFWHMMQEGSGGRSEDDRTPDSDRCRRVNWISWIIQNAEIGEAIRVFRQAPRNSEKPWALWLHEFDYAVILWERKSYYLLKTAFMVKPHKKKEFERDWKAHQARNG